MPYLCQWESCGCKFKRLLELMEHSQVHNNSTKNKPRCLWVGCPKFNQKQRAEEFQAHLEEHTKEKPHVCEYPNCDRKFALKDTLRRHIRSNHEPPTTVQVRTTAQTNNFQPENDSSLSTTPEGSIKEVYSSADEDNSRVERKNHHYKPNNNLAKDYKLLFQIRKLQLDHLTLNIKSKAKELKQLKLNKRLLKVENYHLRNTIRRLN